jgi:hypothetical protein
MREALKVIAGFYNPARKPDPGQAAAKHARDALLSLNLFYQRDALSELEDARDGG